MNVPRIKFSLVFVTLRNAGGERLCLNPCPFILYFWGSFFPRLFVALVHALGDSRRHSGGEIESCIQELFGEPFLPGFRQAVVHSGLAVAHDGDREADENPLPLA